MCPTCGRDAPIVYNGVVPHCTACGALRPPLSGASVNLAGKTSQVGGTLASVIGWIVLVVGGSVALAIVLLFSALSLPGVGFALGIPLTVVTLVLGILSIRRGGAWMRAGQQTERATREQALMALASHRGAVTAVDAARLLGVGIPQADALLTDLAKREPDRVAVDLDDQGGVWYRLADPMVMPRVRVGQQLSEEANAAAEAPVDEEVATTRSRR